MLEARDSSGSTKARRQEDREVMEWWHSYLIYVHAGFLRAHGGLCYSPHQSGIDGGVGVDILADKSR